MGDYSGTVSKILALGGFKAKALIMSRNCDEEERESLGGKFLGVGYCPSEDKIQMKFSTII